MPEPVFAMTRPIVWALAVLGAAGAIAAVTVDRLAQSVAARPPEPVAAALVERAVQPPPSVHGGPVVRLPADGRGHYLAEMRVEGRNMRLLVDTGASIVALRESDAQAAGLAFAFSSRIYQISTANGVVEARGVTIREMRLGSIVVDNVEAVVMPDAQLGTNLLGMSFLNRLRGFEVSGQELILRG